MYTCTGSTVLGYSVGFFLGVSPVRSTGLNERNPVGLSPGESPMVSLGKSNDVRGRV